MKYYNVRVTTVNHHDWSMGANSKEEAIQKVKNDSVDCYFWQTDQVSNTYEAWESEEE